MFARQDVADKVGRRSSASVCGRMMSKMSLLARFWVKASVESFSFLGCGWISIFGRESQKTERLLPKQTQRLNTGIKTGKSN